MTSMPPEIPKWKSLLRPTLKALDAIQWSAPFRRVDATVADLIEAIPGAPRSSSLQSEPLSRAQAREEGDVGRT
jgi:hypothetical protein